MGSGMGGRLPVYVKATADLLHEQVALIRKGAATMDVDLADFTDLEVLAIQHWCQAHTPPGLEASKTMLGLLYTMGCAA
jgi:hypothetical protein